METGKEEPMDVDWNYSMNQDGDEDEALIVLSLKWINPDEPQKMKRPESRLEKMLQPWFKKCKRKVDCSVRRTLTDGRVVIKTEPAPAITDLQKLSKQTLTGKDGSSVTVTSISITLPPPQLGTQITADASMNLPRSLPQTEQVQPRKQSSTASAAGEMLSCSVPLGHFWYVNHMYEEELKRIEKENGVKIRAEVKVKFEVDQKDGSPDKAHDEFTNLIQTSMIESSGSVIPLKFIDPDQWRDALKTIQKKGNKLLVTLTSKGMTACGPKHSQDVISKSLFGDPMQHTKTNASVHEYQREFKDTSLKINPTTTDHLTDAELAIKMLEDCVWQPDEEDGDTSMEGNILKAHVQIDKKTATSPMRIPQFFGATGSSRSLMNTNSVSQPEGAFNGPVLNGQSANRKHKKHVVRIKDKFNVELQGSDISQSKVNVKAFYEKDGGNASMESHALKALLRLCQKIDASPMNFSQFHGASGSSPSLINTNSVSQSEGASNGPVLNGHSGNRKHNTDAPHGGGATAGDSEEEKCPICLDAFKNKKRLKCKHEFCEECLQQAKDANGPICPVCRVVFGKIIGDQPDGKMSHRISHFSLPGFPDCNTIVINYEIPTGIQTEKHPNPGQYFYGSSRSAYLPNNREGNEVLQLLKRAFDQRLIFTIGTSRTTGLDNQVTWNDIPHKTSTSGGPQCFGYPDPEYLSRVKEELKAKGIE